MNRRLRFVRALALVSTGSLVACGARTIAEEGNVANNGEPADTGSIDTAAADTSNAASPGTCLRYNASSRIECDATCTWSLNTGFPACIATNPANPALQACGSIFCLTPSCKCTNPRESTCDCAGAVPGPLPPPDLPTA